MMSMELVDKITCFPERNRSYFHFFERSQDILLRWPPLRSPFFLCFMLSDPRTLYAPSLHQHRKFLLLLPLPHIPATLTIRCCLPLVECSTALLTCLRPDPLEGYAAVAVGLPRGTITFPQLAYILLPIIRFVKVLLVLVADNRRKPCHCVLHLLLFVRVHEISLF